MTARAFRPLASTDSLTTTIDVMPQTEVVPVVVFNEAKAKYTRALDRARRHQREVVKALEDAQRHHDDIVSVLQIDVPQGREEWT